ncbi:hypothetical protein GCM10025864_09840 [Luteimicrobium album]|uniref:Asp23/Gls24 family envelope stress response protein n=2 Tax=Luteimicrobium album TaxID=1054550 RepID=A0ABQ6HXV4_9MICO|nr:hypothetical protein GCM10025864_09840 [Luteimicrobium album]
MKDEHETVPPSGDELLARAASTLRALTDDGWVRAHPRVLERALRVVRPARSVVGRHAHGTFEVAVPVLVTRIREHLDDIGDVRTLKVTCVVDDDDDLDSVRVEVSVAFGSAIAAVAERVRTEVRHVVAAATGVRLDADQVAVDLMVEDVHRPTS